ncbi:patatin-like phospholipase family protein [Anaeromassilibacillus sp. SJQ-1]|uniref:patatin-like phospholipase family protein n=1 Tax=Anaeromassilibacillus sp. SJQ-1 TaxID=3375419 RepID=UPI0039893D95
MAEYAFASVLVCRIEKGESIMPVGLVLEGGGTRGAYTSGVLDVFSKNQIIFPVVYGISAGACNALSYISGQVGRNFHIFYDYIQDDRYMSVASLRRTGNLFGFDFIFGELSRKLLPFDYKAFFESPVQLKAGTTDLYTGKPLFFGKEEMDERFLPVRASSAMPFVSEIVFYQGHALLDGGCSTSIPLQCSLEDGNSYNVVVLTRDASYRKGGRPEFPAPRFGQSMGNILCLLTLCCAGRRCTIGRSNCAINRKKRGRRF